MMRQVTTAHQYHRVVELFTTLVWVNIGRKRKFKLDKFCCESFFTANASKEKSKKKIHKKLILVKIFSVVCSVFIVY